MNAPGTERDIKLALEIAGGRTVLDAAKAAGVPRRTAYRKWADPAFRRHIAGLRADMVSIAAGRLAGGMAEAADALRSLLASPSESIRLAAAKAVLEYGNAMHQQGEMEQRLAEVEARLTGEGLLK